MKLLVDHDFSDYIEVDDASLLHHVCKSGNLNMLKIYDPVKVQLLQDKTYRSEFTPVHFAIMSGNADMVAFIVDKYEIDLEEVYEEKPENFHEAVDLIEDPTDFIIFFVDKGYKFFDVIDMVGNRAMVSCITKGNLEKVKKLVERKVPVDQKNEDDFAPLFVSLLKNQTEIAKFLVESGCIYKAKAVGGLTPLHHAAQNNNLELVKFFVEKGIRVNEIDFKGNSALDLAKEKGYKEIVDFLLSQSASEDAKSLEENKYSLEKALHTKDDAMFMQVMETEGLDVNMMINGMSLIENCFYNEMPDSIAYLIKNGAEVDFNKEFIDVINKF